MRESKKYKKYVAHDMEEAEAKIPLSLWTNFCLIHSMLLLFRRAYPFVTMIKKKGSWAYFDVLRAQTSFKLVIKFFFKTLNVFRV